MNSLSDERNSFDDSYEDSPHFSKFDLMRQVHSSSRTPLFPTQQMNTMPAPEPDSPFQFPAARYHSVNDEQDEPEIQHIPRTKTMDFKTNLDLHSRTIWWIIARLDEMGLKGDPYIIKRTISGYPTGTSREVILEAVIQNIFEGDIDDDEPDEYSRQGFQFENRIIAARPAQYERLLRINALLNNPALHDQVRHEAYCQLCYRLIHGKPVDYRVFSCTQVFCKNCLLGNFKDRIDNGEDIETFRCPDPDCNSRINIEKFISIIPEADTKEMEDKEIGTCNICFETIKGTEDLLKIFECQEHFFCYTCTLNYLKEDINNRKVLDIKCPDSTCESILDDQKMKELVPTYLFNKYGRFKRNAIIERDPNTRWCTRPGCEKAVKGDKNNPKAMCECGQATCLNCGNSWHEKKTCEQALDEEYKMFAKQKDIQFCPECKSRVEKLAGCNHMTCPICTYEWCWLCGGEYSVGHFDPLNPLGCPGLMSGNNTRKDWNKCKILAYRFAILLLFVLLIALAPLWIVLGAILLPNLVYEPRYEQTRTKMVLTRVFLFLIGVILMPLTIVFGTIGAIVPGTCLLASFLIKRRRERQNARIRRRELIKTRGGRYPNNDPVNPDDLENYNFEENLRVEWDHRNTLHRPLLFEEERLPQPRGDISIEIE